MSSNAPILYSGFYDFPLALTVRSGGDLYVSVRDFGEGVDEYGDEYRVFLMPPLMPPLADEQTQSSWLRVEHRATRPVGKVAVKDVRFDATYRKEIDTAVLRALLAPREVALR